MVRDASLVAKYLSGCEIVSGDVHSPSSLDMALKDIDVAYYLVHSMKRYDKKFPQRDREGATHFSQSASRAGIKRIIYLGGLGSDDVRLSSHLESRHEVGRLLGADGVPVTEFRAAIIVGSGSLSFEMIRSLVERLPVMCCPRWVNSLCQPIAIRDVLAYLIQALEEPASVGKIIEIGGADQLTYKEMLLGYARARGLTRAVITLPILSPRLSSYWVDWITSIPPSVSRPLIEGLRHDVICRKNEAAKLFDIQPIDYFTAVNLAIQRIKADEVESIWSQARASLFKNAHLGYELKTHEGMIIEKNEREVRVSSEKLFEIILSLGGTNGWLYANWLWRLRGWIDRICGGVGMRRSRRSDKYLVAGDVVDFWRVEEIKEGECLRLHAEMKVPGKAWLQFEAVPINQHTSRLLQTAFFEPRGVLGHLYWIMLYPIHKKIFVGLCRAIQKKAEEK